MRCASFIISLFIENDIEFRKRLRQHGLSESTIRVLEYNGIVDLQTLRALTEKDITDLGLDIGQRSRLRSLRDKLEKEENENIENMSEETFWCLFKCLGGIGAVGLGGILALAGLVAVALPAIGFTAIGITAGSLAASIMSLYGGAVGAGSLVAILQSVAAAGLGWGTILTTFFGTSTVYAAAKGACSHCFS